MSTPPLQGAKGASTPYEATDTLRSTQRAEIVDLLSEGQIGGLVNGLKSIYLDGTPVENADGSKNFPEFAYRLRLGGPTSEAEHSFGNVATEVAVGVTVLAAVPVVRTITDATADAVRVTVTVPQLVEQKENGDRVGASVELAIDVQSNGGGFVQRWAETITGKATSPYSRAVRLSLTDVGPPPWDVRVRRVTADSTTSNLVNAVAWGSYTVLSGVRMLYRNSATIELVFDAKNFSAIPQRWYDCWGFNDWDIPVNYDPLNRTVAGSWNGLWKQGPTNNPAWVLYNLVKHPRYGLGEYVAQLPDKWTLYQLALWCDEPLSDGRGGLEPRYSINAWITEQQEALRLLQDICSVFRGVLMHSGAMLTTTWDAPGVPVASYTPANVVDGLFTYADASSAGKKSSCTCWYTDRRQAGKREAVTWDDPDLVAAYGLRNFEINPMGVASPSQALRMAKWAVYTAHFEGQTVAFRVGAEGPTRRLGEIFQLSDPAETGERLGGRIHSATTTVVQLDAPVTLAAGETYTLWVTQPHPTDVGRLVQESRTVTTGAGLTGSLTVTPAFSAAPLAQTVWLLEGTDVVPTLWRYVAINEVVGDNGRPEFDVLGVRHEPGKFDLIERDQPLTRLPTRRLTYAAPPVASIAITETVYFDPQGNAHIRATVSWPIPAPGLRYVLTWRLDNGAWHTEPPISSNTVDANDLQPGVYEVQVQTLNALGKLSPAVTATAILVGDTSRPDNVVFTGYQIVPGGVRIAFDPNLAPGHSKTRLSYGPTFATSTFFWEGNATDTVVRPPADGTYLVWGVHLNRRDVPSLVPTSIEVVYVAAAAGTNGLNNAQVRLYQRNATQPPKPNAAVTYTFATGAVTGLTNGWLADIPAGTGTIWTVAGPASATTPTDSIGTSEWGNVVVLAADGQAGASAPVVELSASTQVFLTPANSSTPGPATTTITATITNISAPTYQWTVDGAVQGASGGTLVMAAFAAGATKQVQVTVSGSNGSAFDRISIYSVREGSDSIAAGLENEFRTVAADSAGNPSPAGQFPLTTQAYVVRGANLLSSGVTYGIQAGSNQGFSSPSISSTGAVSIAGMTADTASVVFTATVGSVTILMRFGAVKSRAGQQGNVGNTGVSLRTAYALYTGNPLMSGGTVQTVGPTSLPASNAWSPSSATAYTANVQTPGAGQALLMTQGSFDAATNLTTWQLPFLSNLKVGTLSALTSDLGFITAGSIDTTGSIKVGGANGAITVFDPASGAGVSRTVSIIANLTGNSAISYYGKSFTGGVPAIFGENTSLSLNSSGVFGLGLNGVYGKALSSGAGVRGESSATSGSSGVIGTSGGTGTAGVTAQQGLAGGVALNVIGNTTASGEVQVGSLRINQASASGTGAWTLPHGGITTSGKPGVSSTGVFIPMNRNGIPGHTIWWASV